MKNIYINFLTSNFFNKEYVENKKSFTQLSKETGICSETIRRYAEILNVNKRTRIEQTIISSSGGKKKYNDVLTRKFFNENYIKNKMSITQIANMVGAYWATVKTYAISNEIKLRTHKEQAAISSPGGKWKHDDLLTKKFLLENYIDSKKSIKELSKETGLHYTVIRGYMKKHEIPVRTCHEQMNISHPPKKFRLTKECIAFIDGLMLGDGSVPLRKGGNPRNYTQGCKHKEYLGYVACRLKKYGITSSPILTKWIEDFRCKNNGYLESFLQTHSYETFRTIRERWYDENGTKHVPQDVVFTPDSILQFYLGDGNFYREVILCTNGFSIDDIRLLQKMFEEHLKIKTRIVNSETGYEIAIKKSDLGKFLAYIGVCPVKCYKYKWQDNESEEKKLEKNRRAREIYHLKRIRLLNRVN